MANYLHTTFNSLQGILSGRGKDQYTQTIPLPQRHTDLTKGEQWVSTEYSKLYHLYNTTAELKLVINRKANMYANGIWKHVKNGKLVENSPFVRRLDNPNPLMNGNEFLRAESINYDVFGNSFIYNSGGVSGTAPALLSVLPSQNMVIKRSGKIFKQTDINDIIDGYYLMIDNQKNDEFETNDIIHLKTTNPNDPVMGESLMVSLTMDISNCRGAKGFRNRIITSNGALGIMSTDSADGMGVTLDVEEQKRVNKAHSDTFGMQEGKANYLMTEATVKFTHTAYPTKDLLLFEEVDSNLKRIIDTYGLNDNVFSFQKASTFANLQQGIKLCYQDCIKPFAADRSIAMTKSFGMDGTNEYVYLCYDHLEILQQDMVETANAEKIRAETYAILSENGLVDVANEMYNEE